MPDIIRRVKAPEPLLPPVEKFNDTVGVIFNRCPMPSDAHHDYGLQRALSWLLNAAFKEATKALEKYATHYVEFNTDEHSKSLMYQNNLRYLRYRFNYFRIKLNLPSVRDAVKDF